MKLLEGSTGLAAETDHVNGNGKIIMSAYEMMSTNNQVQYQHQDGNNHNNISNNVHNSAAVTVDQIHTTNNVVVNECTVREQDRFMPIANVIRIMRKILPPHAKISDDAKETIQECVSEYISFITGEANERCQREQRKTITAEDVLWAMSKLGFDDYIEPLTLYLHRYRELEGDRGSSLMRSCDPLLKINRAAPMEHCQYAAAPYGVFHIPHPAYFGAPPSSSSATVRAYFKEPNSGAASDDGVQPPSASASSASSVSATTFEPYAQHHD